MKEISAIKEDLKDKKNFNACSLYGIDGLRQSARIPEQFGLMIDMRE